MDSMNVDASCAICGAASALGECPHEGQRLELALNQAMMRWAGVQTIRDWVLNHARNQVILTFRELKESRRQAHVAYLQTLPCYTLYQRYHGNPPLHPSQLAFLNQQLQQANQNYKAGVDEDWRRSCMQYPDILDYYFGLVDVSLPRENDPLVQEPRFGGPPPKGTARVKAPTTTRRKSVDVGEGHRKKDRRRSRGRTPPPPAPMPGSHRHGVR